MADLIDRQAAIDAVHDWEQWYTWDEYCKEEPDASYVISPSKVISGLPSAQPEQRWVPASERLPEEPFGCIVSYHGFMLTPHGEREYDAIYPELLGYDGTDWNNSEGECVDNMIDVTAWMPLPEPWKGERDVEIH